VSFWLAISGIVMRITRQQRTGSIVKQISTVAKNIIVERGPGNAIDVIRKVGVRR
jgi:hypothetical protein